MERRKKKKLKITCPLILRDRNIVEICAFSLSQNFFSNQTVTDNPDFCLQALGQVNKQQE
jgi:hypothetical protein